MAPSVLILTQEFDPTADPVVAALAAREAQVSGVDLSYFPRTMTLTEEADRGLRVLATASGRWTSTGFLGCGTGARPRSTSARRWARPRRCSPATKPSKVSAGSCGPPGASG